jgi:hypothetical protein
MRMSLWRTSTYGTFTVEDFHLWNPINIINMRSDHYLYKNICTNVKNAYLFQSFTQTDNLSPLNFWMESSNLLDGQVHYKEMGVKK